MQAQVQEMQKQIQAFVDTVGHSIASPLPQVVLPVRQLGSGTGEPIQ
jgi:hypothetical protein